MWPEGAREKKKEKGMGLFSLFIEALMLVVTGSWNPLSCSWLPLQVYHHGCFRTWSHVSRGGD